MPGCKVYQSSVSCVLIMASHCARIFITVGGIQRPKIQTFYDHLLKISIFKRLAGNPPDTSAGLRLFQLWYHLRLNCLMWQSLATLGYLNVIIKIKYNLKLSSSVALATFQALNSLCGQWLPYHWTVQNQNIFIAEERYI